MREGDRRLSCPATFPGRFLKLPAGGESPGGSGWRSCAAAQQLPELAAAERWAGKLSPAFLQLAAGGSPLDTPPPRYVRARPRGATARVGAPLAAPLALRPFRPRALQAARCLSALRKARLPVHGRDRTGLPDPRAWEGGVGPAVFTLGGAGTHGRRCVGSGRPGLGGQRSGRCAVLGKTSPPPRLSSLFLSAVSSDPRGALGPLPSGRVTASVGKVCWGFAFICRCRDCALGLAHRRELRSPQQAPSGCCAGGAERCRPEPRRERPRPPLTD